MTKIFNGKEYAEQKEKLLRKKVVELNIHPHLAAIYIGKNTASEVYLNLKSKAAERIGATVSVYKLEDQVSEESVLQLIEFLNSDDTIHGIMVQLPIPSHLNQEKILESINPRKDVDGQREQSNFLPATITAIVSIMVEAEVPEKGSVVVIGEEGEVGRKLVKVLREKHFSVMGVDVDTKNPLEVTRMADVLITATGKSNLVKAEWVKNDAAVIDVGAPHAEVDFNSVSKKARFITPVPGGVGPVTVVSLLQNLVEATLNQVH